MRIKPLTQYGYLTFMKELPDIIEKKKGQKQKRRRMILCLCKCGVEKVFDFCRVHSGNTKSCGCLRKELLHIEKGTHYASRTKEYDCWCSMKDRCYNPNNQDYDIYGGAGISVCDRWLNSFENFLEDMGYAPTKKHSLDRFPNNKGIYELSNCRWATQKQQVGNQDRNIKIEYKGELRWLIEVCEELNVSPSATRYRIRKGWDIETALTKPIRKFIRKFKIQL